MGQDLEKVNPYPYSKIEYLKRFFWVLIRLTIWRLLWHRIPVLRMGILKAFGAQAAWSSMAFGSTVVFRPWDFSIGEMSALGPRVHVYNLGRIDIGKNTVISQDSYLCGGTHDYTRPNLPLIRPNIEIGSGVWIGAGAFIGPGVTIGNGAVVGARAVVFKDVLPNTIVVGNPARFVKKRIMSED